jgi:hypothetical protein
MATNEQPGNQESSQPPEGGMTTADLLQMIGLKEAQRTKQVEMIAKLQQEITELKMELTRVNLELEAASDGKKPSKRKTVTDSAEEGK